MTSALPLSSFSPDQQEEITRLASADTPPRRYLTFYDENGRPMCELPSRAFYEWYWRRGIDPDHLREKIPEAMRMAVVKRDGMVCKLCGSPITAADLHIDHVKPVSKGGETIISNLQPSHARCNIRKGNKWNG